MEVKVESEITINIGDRKLKMTGFQAKLLFKELEKELNMYSDITGKKIDKPPVQR